MLHVQGFLLLLFHLVGHYGVRVVHTHWNLYKGRDLLKLEHHRWRYTHVHKRRVKAHIRLHISITGLDQSDKLFFGIFHIALYHPRNRF